MMDHANQENSQESKHDTIQHVIRTKFPQGIILDSGCGTGRSTKMLSETYPDSLVIGIDRSIARLTKTKANQKGDSDSKDAYTHSIAPNAYLLRAELVDFWRLCMDHDFPISHLYLLYPNPYPAPQRLTQRWYTHPSFPLILSLNAVRITVRSNWENYLKEFAHAVMIANECYENEDCSDNNLASPYLESAKTGPTERTDKSVAMTNFEAKYDTVGEPTFELILEQQTVSVC